MGIRFSSDLHLKSGQHTARLHGQDSKLVMDFDSLGAVRHLHTKLPKPVIAGRYLDTDPVSILIRVRGTRVATATMTNGRFTIKKHWLGIIRCLFL